MVVVGVKLSVVSNIDSTAEFSPFTPYYESLQKAPIVDADILYICWYTDKSCILIVYNSLSVPYMKQILIPPLILRNSGLQVNSTPKIQSKLTTIEDHSIFFCKDYFRIPFSLWGIFSYFPMLEPTKQIL